MRRLLATGDMLLEDGDVVSAACSPRGDAQCDGYTPDHEFCACHCHTENLSGIGTVAAMKEWHVMNPPFYLTVDDLRDGDVFSLDEGETWHTCAVVLFGNVAVYATRVRGDAAATTRIDADRDAEVLVR